MSLITPPLMLESSALFTPRVSKLKPNDPASYYAKLLASAAAVQTPAWKALEKAAEDLAKQSFGAGVSYRSPIRRDVAGKGWPEQFVAFLNVAAGADYRPLVIGRDTHPVMDQSEVYPGCTVRVSLRIYSYGRSGTPIPPGVSFGLENLQKLNDGERLKTARGDGSEFGAWQDDELASLLQ
jgi:hypothetical protein